MFKMLTAMTIKRCYHDCDKILRILFFYLFMIDNCENRGGAAVGLYMNMDDNAVTVCKSFDDDEVKTIAKFQVEGGTRPVVGWLVCVEGSDKGSDYRVYAGVNRAGRGDASDIRFYGDEQISRGVHFLIIYDPKQNLFFLSPGEGTITRLNGALLTQPQGLKPYDRIEAGETAFDFIPYCIGGHHW